MAWRDLLTFAELVEMAEERMVLDWDHTSRLIAVQTGKPPINYNPYALARRERERAKIKDLPKLPAGASNEEIEAAWERIRDRL